MNLLTLTFSKSGLTSKHSSLKSESFIIGKDGQESKKKFRSLCSQFAEKYQLTLCLACCEIVANQEDEILQFWKDVSLNGYSLLNRVVTLDDFLAKAPSIPVKTTLDGLVVERAWEKSEILLTLTGSSNLLIQGRYRVGKTSLLREICDERKDWKYKEIN